MEANPTDIIEQLLDQNAQLRLELAVLASLKKQQEDIDAQMKQSQNIPPEAMELLSKLDIR